MTSPEDEERSRKRPGEHLNTQANSPACDQCRTRKIRCDRETPRCSNCQKADLSCDFNNKAKRVNHTKQLVEDFSTLNDRLQSIDASIVKITNKLDLVESASLNESTKSLQCDLVFGGDDLFRVARGNLCDEDPLFSGVSTSRRNQCVISIGHHGSETFHGPVSAVTLCQRSKSMVNDLLATLNNHSIEENNESTDHQKLPLSLLADASTKSALQSCQDSFPRPRVPEKRAGVVGTSTIGRPPRDLLDSSVDFYLKEVNSTLPVFDEINLRTVAEEYYDGKHETTSYARSLCLNNIIVIAVGLKLKTASALNIQNSGLDENAFRSFLINSRVSLDNLERLSQPHLINIQTLITLAFVSSSYFPAGLSEMLTHRACALAREMGLGYVSENDNLDGKIAIKERQQLFWTLYTLDKRRSFINGNSCDMYLFESELRLSVSDQHDISAQIFNAHVHMMTIWEKIWIGLYSPRSMRRTLRQREDQVNSLENNLKDWTGRHRDLLRRPEDLSTGYVSSMPAELLYSFHVSQILIHRCLDQVTHHNITLDSARAALRIISQLYQNLKSAAEVFLLAKLLRSFPMLAFYEIHENILRATNDNLQEDMMLLQAAIDSLRLLSSPRDSEDYYSTVCAGMEWCYRLATVVMKASVKSRLEDTKARASASTEDVETMLTTSGRVGPEPSDVSHQIGLNENGDALVRSYERTAAGCDSGSSAPNCRTNTSQEAPDSYADPATHQKAATALQQFDRFDMDMDLDSSTIGGFTSTTKNTKPITPASSYVSPSSQQSFSVHQPSISKRENSNTAIGNTSRYFNLDYLQSETQNAMINNSRAHTSYNPGLYSRPEPFRAKITNSQRLRHARDGSTWQVPAISPPESVTDDFPTLKMDQLDESFADAVPASMPLPLPTLALADNTDWMFQFNGNHTDFEGLSDLSTIEGL